MADIFFAILGWGGSALLVTSMLQTKILRLRWLNLIACAVLVVYNAVLSVWPMAVMNLALVIINVVNLARLRRVAPPVREQPTR